VVGFGVSCVETLGSATIESVRIIQFIEFRFLTEVLVSSKDL